MLLKRDQIEEREKATLATYAVKSAESRGRAYEETPDLYRTCFQHDRDRVIHSKAFRRLKGKTQVFVAHYGDHYRSRLTHSMEVAQISRDMARTLGLNEDLAETIGLAHDLGHTPFGHAGQDTLNEIMKKYGDGFEHNEQSRRIVEVLEEKKPGFPGLNLSFEVRDGLIKHRTPFDKPADTDTFMPSIEAQIVNIADEIAYLNHDIDDGLRAGILKLNDFDKLAIWKRASENVDQSMSTEFRIPAMISTLISIMVEDLVKNTDELIKKSGIKSVDDVYKHKFPLSAFSGQIRTECSELKSFLYDNFYRSSGVSQYNLKGKEVIQFLFEKLMSNFSLLPEKIRTAVKSSESQTLIKDYISGMTDQFAMDLYEKLKMNN